jgi:4-hydroxyproline epimerase
MSSSIIKRVKIIDSHTGGEPTRVVISGGPDLGGVRGLDAAALELARDDADHGSPVSAAVRG